MSRSLPKKPALKNPKPDTDSRGQARKIVAFDFDGTLTYKDSFTSFLLYARGALRVGASFLLRPAMLTDFIRTGDRGALKSQLLYKLMGPIPQDELELLVRAFVASTGMGLFRPDALRAWRAHESDDVQRVIVTASPQLLVAPFGALIGADRVIGTRLGFSADARLQPALEGENCRGEEKVRRLRETFGHSLDLEAAYGDTSGDREMLAAARAGYYRVFRERP